MNCPDCQNQFSDFIDDEISLKMALIVKEHLASCPSCAAEWQLFQHTVTTLHSLPIQPVPAHFIVGINEKLTPQSFATLKGWLSLMSLHKVTTSTALATLAVGVISAALFQLSPVASDHSPVARQGGADKSGGQAMAKNHTNYYPGIPYLAQNSPAGQPAQSRTRVQFTPVKYSDRGTDHNSILARRNHQALAQGIVPHPALSHLKSVSPDMIVTVHSSSTSQQHTLIRQLTTNRNWKTQISGNTLLVTLPCSQLANFQDLFGPADPHINPRELSRLSTSQSSRVLTVAVAFH